MSADALPEDVRGRIERMANNLRGAQRPECGAVEFKFDKFAAFEMESALRTLLATVERLAGERMAFAEALVKVAASDPDFEDCIDNHGSAYQSVWLAGIFDAARRATTTDQGEG